MLPGPCGTPGTHNTHGPFLVPSTQDEELYILLRFTPENTRVQRGRGPRSRSRGREGARPESALGTTGLDTPGGAGREPGRTAGATPVPSTQHSTHCQRDGRSPHGTPTRLQERRRPHPKRRETAAGGAERLGGAGHRLPTCPLTCAGSRDGAIRPRGSCGLGPPAPAGMRARPVAAVPRPPDEPPVTHSPHAPLLRHKHVHSRRRKSRLCQRTQRRPLCAARPSG